MSRLSLRAAIDAQCKQCVYDDKAKGTWREQVRDCQGYSCPLYPVRPSAKAPSERPPVIPQ